MTTRRSSRTYQDPQRSHAKVLAAREELASREEPMRRWPHPIPMADTSTPTAVLRTESEVLTPAITQALEQLQTQSQVLVDLLGAVNSLTAAVLCQKNSG